MHRMQITLPPHPTWFPPKRGWARGATFYCTPVGPSLHTEAGCRLTLLARGQPAWSPLASSRSRSAMKAPILDDTSSRCACNCSRAPTSNPLSVISASIDRIEASSLNIPLSIFLIRRLRAAPPPLRAGPALVLNPRPSFAAAQPTNGTSGCRPGAHTVREHRSQPCALAAHLLCSSPLVKRPTASIRLHSPQGLPGQGLPEQLEAGGKQSADTQESYQRGEQGRGGGCVWGARGKTARRSCRGCSLAREAAATRAAPAAGRRVRGGVQPAEQQRQQQKARSSKAGQRAGSRASGFARVAERRRPARGTAAGQVGAQGANSQQQPR